MDIQDFEKSIDGVQFSRGRLDLRPVEIDLNSMVSWKQEALDHLNAKRGIRNKSNKKFFRKVDSKAKHTRKIVVTLSTKPSRLKFIANIINRIDVVKYNALVVVNLPRKFGPSEISYPPIPVTLTSNPRVVVKWLPEDLGPYSKVLPTLRHLFYRATANKLTDRAGSPLTDRSGGGYTARRLRNEVDEISSRDPRELLSSRRTKPVPERDAYSEYETISSYDAANAVVISIDDDTIYPVDLIKRMLVSLNTVRFRAVVAICGVNITDWGLENACGHPIKSSRECSPFASVIDKENHPLFAHFGDVTNRHLTPIDVFKGFTGVAYPMDIVSRDFLATVQKWRTLPILPIDKLRGFAQDSCVKR